MNFKASNRTWLRSTTALVTATAAAAAMMTPSGVAFAQGEEADDEIIVTGSYIRRGNFDTPTPLNIVDQSDILEQGTTSMGDVIRQQTFNNGSAFQGNRASGRGEVGSDVAPNLRGLGGRATLTLMNGRRSVTATTQRMYPIIGIQRVETLKDGASALYGSDAISGVVNFIPFTDYEGMKVDATYKRTDNGDWDDLTIAGLWGAGNDTTNLVAAFSWYERSDLDFIERLRNSEVGFGSSTTANPGNFFIPDRDEFGEYTGRSRQVTDPECENPANGSDPSNFGEFLEPSAGSFLRIELGGGVFTIPTSGCMFNFQSPYQYVPSDERLQAYTSITHDITDNLTYHGEFVFNRSNSTQNGSITDPGALDFNIPGTNPGNPFRAANSLGEPLFAQDIWGPDGSPGADGLPDRDASMDLDKNGVPDIIVTGTNPLDGIPFFEDVNGAKVRSVGNLGPRGTVGVTEQGGTLQEVNYHQERFVNELTWEIPNTSWLWNTAYIMDRSTLLVEAGDISKSRMILALNCQGGFSGDECFNPFGNHAFTDAQLLSAKNGGGANTLVIAPDSTFEERSHSAELVEWLFIHDTDKFETTLNVVDTVLTGDLFELPAGTVGAAIGGQWRRERDKWNVSQPRNQFDRLFFGGASDVDLTRDVWSAFGELAVPLFDSDSLGRAELQAAVRYEDFGDGINTIDPKFAVLWQPIDNLSLRASWGTSFTAPTANELIGPLSVGLSNVVDKVFIGDFDPGGFKQTILVANANLSPETSKNYNIGFSWEVIEDLTFTADWWDYSFTDRLTAPNTTQILNDDNDNFEAAGGTFGDADDAATWATGAIQGGSMIDFGIATPDPRINRSPASGVLISIDRQRLNASVFETSGLDFGANWRFSGDQIGLGDVGNFSAGVEVTWINTYKFLEQKVDPDDPDPPVAVSGVGSQNGFSFLAPPLPEWRINTRLTWSYDDTHSASIIGRWYSTMKQFNSFNNQTAGVTGPVVPALAIPAILEAIANPDAKNKIHAQATFDVQYNYRFDGWLFDDDRQTVLTFGAINVLDNKPPKIVDFGGLETFTSDIRNRQWYARVSQEL